jgi:hypothetical protein
MELRIGIAAAVLLVAALVAWWLRRRRPQPPSRAPSLVPRQLDRHDFARPEAPWLVAYFSSAMCASCQGLGPKVKVLESVHVVTHETSWETDRALHERYEITALPMILIANREGVVERAFVGATTATDLWAAVAEVRAPGSSPEPELGSVE